MSQILNCIRKQQYQQVISLSRHLSISNSKVFDAACESYDLLHLQELYILSDVKVKCTNFFTACKSNSLSVISWLWSQINADSVNNGIIYHVFLTLCDRRELHLVVYFMQNITREPAEIYLTYAYACKYNELIDWIICQNQFVNIQIGHRVWHCICEKFTDADHVLIQKFVDKINPIDVDEYLFRCYEYYDRRRDLAQLLIRHFDISTTTHWSLEYFREEFDQDIACVKSTYAKSKSATKLQYIYRNFVLD